MCTDSIKLLSMLHFTQHGQDYLDNQNVKQSKIMHLQHKKMPLSSWPGPKHERTGNPTRKIIADIH